MLPLVAAIALAVAVIACGTPAPSTPPETEVAATSRCDSEADRGVLPAWARGGFSDPEPMMPHVISASGEITAILFGDPLSSPPSTDHENKILWVLRSGQASPLGIVAQRMDGVSTVGEPVDRRVEQFPGPSTVDLPEPGCWRLTLSWAEHTDTLDLEYVSPG